nr:aminoacyl-tRNA synthetase, class 1a, anticodon-binding [Tanacetum cinerariifolium]
MVEPHPSTDPMHSPPRQSSPPPIPFGPTPSSGIASTDPISDIPFSSRPSDPVLETITSPIRDDDTGGGSFSERPPMLSDSEDEEDARQSQELAALLNLANDALHEQSHIDRAAKIIYKCLKKQQSSSNTALSDAAIPAVDPDSAVRVDSADDLVSAGVDSAVRIDSADDLVYASTGSAGTSVDAGPSVPAVTLSPIRDPAKGKAIATLSSPAKAKRDKPMTPTQQREYMRTFVKNQNTAIYTTGWTWKDVQGLSDDQLQNVYDKIQRVVDLNNAKAHHHHFKRIVENSICFCWFHNCCWCSKFCFPADTPIAAGVPTTTAASGSTKPTIPLRKSSRKKSMARKRTLPKPVSLALVSDVHTWEIIPTEFGLGEIHVITRADGTIKRFYTLRELMHWAGQADLMVLYGMVSDKYKLKRATCIGLGLWSDIRTLITVREDKDVSIIWDDQDQWEIRSWRFYPLLAIHVLETEAGDIIYMFIDKKYSILPATIQKMINHGLKIDRDLSGNDITTAIQLIRSLLNQLPPAS